MEVQFADNDECGRYEPYGGASRTIRRPCARTDDQVALVNVSFNARTSGVVQLTASPQHLLKMHLGAPVRGRCDLGLPFRYIRGDLDIIPAGSKVTWEAEDASMSLFVHMDRGLLSEAAQQLGLPPERAALQFRYQFRDASIEHIARALEYECRANFPSGQLFRDTLGMALATRLVGATVARVSRSSAVLGVKQPRRLSQRQLQHVMGYIEAHLHEDLSLQALAGPSGFSASHFRALFKHSTGIPVHTYVLHRRVERAKALLLRRDMPASQVALEAGFAHQSHMTRWMRRILGLTPSALLRDP